MGDAGQVDEGVAPNDPVAVGEGIEGAAGGTGQVADGVYAP